MLPRRPWRVLLAPDIPQCPARSTRWRHTRWHLSGLVAVRFAPAHSNPLWLHAEASRQSVTVLVRWGCGAGPIKSGWLLVQPLCLAPDTAARNRYPKALFSSKLSCVLMMCQAARASLCATALNATVLLVFAFFVSKYRLARGE